MGVADDEGGPDRGGHEPSGAADVEDAAVGVEVDRDEVAVAGHAAYGGGGEVEAVLGDAVSRAACSGVEVVVVDRDADAGSGAVAVGDGVGVEGVLGEGEECVPEPGAVISRVGLFLARVGIDGGNRGGGGGEGEEGGAEGGAVLGRAGAA